MATVAEKLCQTPLTESIITFDLQKNHADCLPYFGYQAIKTAVENVPLNVSECIAPFISTLDIENEKVQNQVALVLDTGYSIRLKVRKVFVVL